MRYFISLTLALATFAAQAQELPEGWTLDRCVLYAVEHSPETNIQTQRNTIVRQDYREAIARLLPSLNTRADAELSAGRSLVDYNYVDTPRAFSTTYQALSDLTIFAGMRNVNNIRMQRVNRATGRHEMEAVRDKVAYETMSAFFNVLYYKQMTLLAESQLDESRLNLRQTDRMTELGIKGFPDLAEMRAKEAADSYNLTRQRNMLAIGIILLKERMNLPVDTEFDIAPYETGADSIAVKTPETPAGLYARALTALPRALAAKSQAESSRIALQIARGARFPTLSMNAGVWSAFSNVDKGRFAEQFKGKRRQWVGATLSIPIFNGLSTSSDIRRSRAQLTIAQIERDTALRTLYTEIEQAVADMNGSADQHTQALRQREAASVAHDVNRRKYEEGLVSALELHTSSNRLTQARADELQSRLTYILKKRMVDYYAGTPLVPMAN
jgi:outer membrane protein